MEPHSKSRYVYCWNILGVIFILIGISLLFALPVFLNNELLKSIQLSPNSSTFPEWHQQSSPLYMDFYFFNWTNPHEIKDNMSKPIFHQLGPYRFLDIPEKTNITFDENSTVTYQKFSYFYFDPEGSNGSLSDVVTTINTVAIIAGKQADGWNYFFQKGLSLALWNHKEQLHVSKTAKELLFEGYDDEIVKLSLIVNKHTPFSKVGFMLKMNGTEISSDKFTIDTGADDISKIGSIKRFNDLPAFPFYEDECKKLKGSTGEFFQPDISIDEPIHLFMPEMCRSISFDYETDVKLRGVNCRKFSAGKRTLDNGTLYAENKCYAGDGSMPSGIMNVSVCHYDQPMFITFPHFYESDDSYGDAVEGLSPEKTKHQSHISIEPTTGLAIELIARFQTNFLLNHYADNNIPLFQDVPKILMPLFWIEIKFRMGDENVSKLKFSIDLPFYGRIAGVLFLIIGIVIFYATHLIYSSNKRTSKRSSNVDDNDLMKEMKSLVQRK